MKNTVRKMYKDIKDVYAHHLAGMKFDIKLYTAIRNFRIGWSVKSPDYIEFLGSNLLGVQAIRYSTLDDETFFNDILGIDLKILKMDLHALNGINSNWKVSSNPTYLTLIYLMYAFINSNDIGKNTQAVLDELYYIFAYKTISSKITHGFKHQVKESIAKATYERLSNRYILKKVGSWQKLFEYRAGDVDNSKGLHYKNLTRLDTDKAVIIINDLQGRINDVFKNIYGVMMEIINGDGNAINNSSLNTTNAEGEESIADITDRPDKYITYLKDIIGKPTDFVNNDVLVLTCSVMNNDETELVKKVLIDMSNEKLDKDMTEVINVVILNSISYLKSNNIESNYVDNLMEVLISLKGYWSSSRITEKDSVEVKKILNKIVSKSIHKKTKWLIVTIVINIILFIFIRSITKGKM